MYDLPGMLKVPAEVSERILTMTDPLTVSAMSQSCSFFRDLILRPVDQHLWRNLFLVRFDDPRSTFKLYGGEPKEYPWSAELKRRIHTEVLLVNRQKRFGTLSLEKQKLVLQTLTDVISRFPSPNFVDLSRDLVWIETVVYGGRVLSSFKTSASGDPDVAELFAQLHVYWGLTKMEATMPNSRALRNTSRSFVYDLGKYREDNGWGPFLRNQPGKVSWIHIDHLINVVTLNLRDFPQLWARVRPTSGLRSIRPYSAPGVNETMKDWAGVEGYWYRYVCFMDYRDLFAFNLLTTPDATPATVIGPLNASIFQEPDFREAIRLMALHLRVVGYLPCESHPQRPTIKFAGTTKGGVISNVARIEGTVSMTPDNQVRWTYIACFDGEVEWLSEGFQMGAVGSAMGVLGTWTGAKHAARDPVGPFWQWKVDKLDI